MEHLAYKFLLMCTFLISCGPTNPCYINFYQNITNYDINVNAVTPAGFQLDTGGYPIDEHSLDARLLKIESCLTETAKEINFTTDQLPEDWQCLSHPLDILLFRRECLVIKFVESAYSPCTPEEEFLPIEAPQTLCKEKGLKPNPDCPCRWRTAIQDDNYLIVPWTEKVENMNLWDLIRVHTGCNLFWSSPLSKCAGF